MKRLLFDVNNQVDVPVLILESKSGKRYGRIDGETELKYKRNFNAANEISFIVPKYINGQIHHLWNSITDLKTIYIPDFEERYQISVKYNDEEIESKSVVGTSLCEAELGQILLRNFECNTDDDLEVHNYQVTKFYDEENPNCSLLHRILSEKASHYTIKYVADTLRNLSYEYTADEKSIYDFLTQDIAEQMQCLFLFDSMTRGIYVYDLCSTCNDCYEETIEKQYDENGNEVKKHYRDDFHDECPQCHSRNINSGYGKDTTILIDRENLATSIVRETDIASLKNCLCVDGGDDLITDTFMMLNPNGSQYIYYFSDEVLSEMPQEFKNAYREYTKSYDDYYSSNVVDTTTTTHKYNNGTMTTNDFDANSKDSNYVDAYNAVVNYIANLSTDDNYIKYKTYSSKYIFIGQPSLVTAYYNAIDVEGFLKTDMMPTYNMLVYDKYTALSMLTASAIGVIGISGFGSTTVETVVKNAIIQSAKTIINTALFDVDVKTTIPYTHGDTTWTGVFVITDKQNDDDATNTIDNQTYESVAIKEGHEVAVSISPTITLTINDDVATYCQNRIKYIVENSDLPVAVDLYELDKEVLSDDEFEQQIKLYSIDKLTILKNVMQSCMDVLSDKTMNINNSDTVNNKLLGYYNTYRDRQSKINNEIAVLTGKILDVQKFQLLIYSYIKEIQKILNFQTFLQNYSDEQNLWDIFNYYRREDTYTNENIISEGIETNNANVVKHASYLMDFAKKAAIKAGTPQMTINTSLNNLLMIPEFATIINDFEVGNWIKVRTDINDNAIEDPIYNLRLLSYSINFDDIQNIEVEFSTATKTWSGIRDIKSVIESAQSMATSFTTIAKQVEKSTDVTAIVNTWANDGLNLTNQAIVSQANDQSILIDEHGILARRYDEFSDTYDNHQLKIFNNGLYYSTDAWESIKTGIGKFKYIDPKDWEEKTGYGVIADTIVGNLILGETLSIYNSKGSLQFTDKNGLVISNNINTITINPDANDKRLFKITNSSGIDVLYTDDSGNLNFTGALNGGQINIGNGNFYVDADGNMITNNAQITGNINALNITANQKYRLYHGGVEIDFITSWISPAGLSLNARIGTNNNCYIRFVETQSFDINTGRRFQDLELKSDCICMYGDVVAPHISGCCTTLANGGNTNLPMTFNWSGQLGQPEYVWGGNDGANMYVYNPSNFNVDHSKTTRWLMANGTGRILSLTDDNYLRTYPSVSAGNGGGDNGVVSVGSPSYRFAQVYVTASSISTSDRNLKDDIKPLTDKHLEFFMKLIPVSFTFINGTSGRTHIGFISQDVEQAMTECGLTDLDFAGFCKDIKKKHYIDENGNEIEEDVVDENGNLEYVYSLRYEEFIALNTYILQKTRNELSELKDEVNNLKTFLQYEEVTS